ncbi:MAG: VWA domain-containing protein [Bacteroidales bacterium]|nr:VWA domain-containing protein [Bacteroidales bacterium]MDY0217110.1 VWA domain-containing protein [Bacteroidales bacterium]
MMKKIALILFCSLFLFNASIGKTQTVKGEGTTRILFIFDASKSMWGRWQSDTKIKIAQTILSEMLDSLSAFPDVQLGLRVFGHQYDFPPQVCNDTRLEVPLSFNSIPKIKHRLKTIFPRGTTPIALSLEACANDFPPCDNCRNIVILITDGIEECGGDPCAVSLALQKKGIILKPFVIGVGLDFKEMFDCVGTYFDGSTEKKFRESMAVVISHALNKTTAQVNLLDEHKRATETNVVYTLQDGLSDVEYYTHVHTMNAKGIPDTLILDPIPVYRVVAYTLPHVISDTVSLTQGKHTIIPANTPQGKLTFVTPDKNTKYRNVPIIIRESGSLNTLNVQYFFTEEMYLTQKFDAEVLCLPRVYIKDIQILQNQITKVEIPEPGVLEMIISEQGSGSLFVLRENEQKEWIYNIKGKNKSEKILLQPGSYRIVFRSNLTHMTTDTKIKDFSIESNKTLKLNLMQD